MPNLSAWVGARSRYRRWRVNDVRTAGVANIIADNPASIVIVRRGSVLAAQTVRIAVFGNSYAEKIGLSGNADLNTQRVLVLGYRGHATIADTDIQPMDEFKVDGMFYRVVKVEPGFTDRVEAIAESTD